MGREKLPKTVYVHWESDGDGGFYLAADIAPGLRLSVGESETIGTYELKNVTTYEAIVRVKE